LPDASFAVRVDRLLERADRVDVRRHLAALDLLDDGAQQRSLNPRVVHVVGMDHRRLAPRRDHRDRLEVRDHPARAHRPPC
jgi:hypothetical protein